jgi:putative transposase
MRDLMILLVHLITTVFRLARPGGLRSMVAESVLIKHQLLIVNRSRRRPPNLRALDRLIAGFCSLWIKPTRLLRAAIVLKPSILLHFHRALVQRKYRLLFSPKRRGKPGPKGPNPDLVRAVVDMKQRNPTWGCPRIAEQIALAFSVPMNKDVVWRILALHYRPAPDGSGPSWLTFLGHMKDSLWSVDLLRCESVALRTYWVLVVMDQYTRRIVGFGVQSGIVDGSALCRMFKQAIRGQGVPRYLSSDHDPLYRFHQWQANLRVLGVTEIKTVPYVPLSHPFVERLIGTVRRECLDHLLFWTAADLEMKLSAFKGYYNGYRVHTSLEDQTPIETPESKGVNFKSYRWQKHCHGLYQTPTAA